VFCSSCGYEAKDGSAFCSKCGNKLATLETAASDTAENLIAKIEKKFAPVNDFEVFVFTSNYTTCIAKYPEFQILYNKNKPEIEAIEKIANDREKEIISHYYSKWEILQNLQKVWSPNDGSALRKQAFMIQFVGVLKIINEIISKLKSKATSKAVLEMKDLLAKRKAIYKVKSKYLLVSNIKIPRNQPVGINEIVGNKIKVIHLGDKAESQLSIVGPTFIDNSNLTEPISGWVSKKEFVKRTNYTDIIKSQ
jgi:hypothetical protein